jgi:hypothetical protein
MWKFKLRYVRSDMSRGTIMSQIRSFLPWIAFSLAAGLFGWRAAAAIALVLAIVGLARDGRSVLGEALRVATAAYFGGLALLALFDPTTPVRNFIPALAPATLAIAAAATIAVGRPFTTAFAKRVAPREYWDTPMFMHINVVLTGVWATSFAASAALIGALLIVAPHAAAVVVLAVEVAAFVIPMRISKAYPTRARARYATLANEGIN